MPRTKVVRQPKAAKNSKEVNELLEIMVKMKQTNLDEFNAKYTHFMRLLNSQCNETQLSIPRQFTNHTIGELMEANASQTTYNITASTTTFPEGSNSTSRKTRYRRSTSLAADEGYLTAESVGSSGGRPSRPKKKEPKTARVSRSLSTKQQRRDLSASKYKTPSNRAIPVNSYGTVTPKVNPRTPQVLLRRAQLGEMAISLQGSPLFTGHAVGEAVANVNIPLLDGRMLSLQPERGLRISQIPELDLETKRQLQLLRDNLNKVCAAAGAR